MKRFMIYCLVLAFIAAIPLSHSLIAAKQTKYTVCHITHVRMTVNPCTGAEPVREWRVGHVIKVAEAALKAHWDHGDHKPGATKEIGDCCGWLQANFDSRPWY